MVENQTGQCLFPTYVLVVSSLLESTLQSYINSQWSRTRILTRSENVGYIDILVSFSCVPYVPEPEDSNLLKTALNLYRKFKQYPDAMQCAIQLNDMELVKEIFMSCKDMWVPFRRCTTFNDTWCCGLRRFTTFCTCKFFSTVKHTETVKVEFIY